VGCGESSPAGFAHPEALTVGEDDEVFGSSVAVNLPHLFYLHDDRSMNAGESGGVELAAQLFDALPEHVFSASDVQTGVVVGGFDPLDIGGVEQNIFCSIANDEALLTELFVTGGGSQRSEGFSELFLSE
jgi:hypothetical protein